MSDFQPVTRKKWLARRSLQRPRRNSDRTIETHIDVDVQKFSERIERLCVVMRNSDYFIQAMTTMTNSLSEFPSDFKIKRIICLGLGPFTRQFQALHQFVFIIALQRHCNIKEASYYDPVFSSCEKQILKKLSCIALSENMQGKHVADVPTLFYLPHCPNCLTNNLLWRNWKTELLQNVMIINNSFSSLVTNKPQRILKQEAEYILRVQPFTREHVIEDDYETHNIFNDLSLHFFPTQTLPNSSDREFWAEAQAPVYENDDELVCATQLAKLTL